MFVSRVVVSLRVPGLVEKVSREKCLDLYANGSINVRLNDSFQYQMEIRKVSRRRSCSFRSELGH